MESIDKGLQQRVWSRVQGEKNPPQASQTVRPTVTPEGLLLEELTDIRRLQQFPDTPAIRALIDQARERAAILRGICRLSGITPPGQLPKRNPAESSPALPRRLIGDLLRRHREYCRLSDHGEYGVLYEQLAALTRTSCALLAQHIGTPDPTNSLHNRRK